MERYRVVESEDGYGRVFVAQGPWQTDYKDLIEKEGIAVLRLSAAMGWRGTDLGFLRELRQLRGIEIYSQDVQDASVIASLQQLRLVGLECDLRTPIDFTGLLHLEVAKATWKSAIESLLQCSGLKHLNLSNWPGEDLRSLASMTRLTRLQLTSRRLASLDGISSLNSLDWVDLDTCPQLTSLEDIRACPNISHLEITSCKAVRDISAIGELGLLRELHLDNNGAIETLVPLQVCQLLERLSFFGTTRISDGRLSAIEGLPKLKTLRFEPRRHYDRTRDEILSLHRKAGGA